MRLIDLIDYLLDRYKLTQLCQDLNLPDDQDPDNATLVYMNNVLDPDSELSFFTVEETDDLTIFEKDGIRYVQFFPLFYAADLIQLDLDLLNKGYSESEIAQRLFKYRMNDA